MTDGRTTLWPPVADKAEGWPRPLSERFAVEHPATWQMIAGAAVVGVLADQAIRSGLLGAAGATTVVAATAVLWRSGRLRSRDAQVVASAAPLFGVWLAVRTSPWLVPFDLIASGGLLVLAASLSTGGTLGNLRIADLVARLRHAIGHGCLAADWVRPLVRGRVKVDSNRAAPIIVGLAIAIPVVAILGALLASADAVFASFVRLDTHLDGGTLALSGVLIVMGTWAMVGLLRLASAHTPEPLARVPWTLGRVEIVIVLGGVEILFGLFALAQLLAATGAADQILEAEGVTYAEYARSGFFQLLWVAGLTISGLLALRAVIDAEDDAARRVFRRLAVIAIGLTLMIVAVAVRGLLLYKDAYGLTMLRLYCLLFALWIVLALVLLAAEIAGTAGGRSWFPAASGMAALAVLLALNVVNPEGIVVRHNLAREQGPITDIAYLADLSDDAVPTLVALVPALDPELRQAVVDHVCESRADDPDGLADWNLGSSRAAAARRELCPPHLND